MFPTEDPRRVCFLFMQKGVASAKGEWMLQAAVLDQPANQRACCKSTVQITLRNSLLTLFFFCRVKLEAL